MMTSKSRFIPSYLTGEPVQPESSDESSQNSIPRQTKDIRPREIQHPRKVTAILNLQLEQQCQEEHRLPQAIQS